MPTTSSLLSAVHLFGFALGTGCATAKLVLLLKCRTDPAFAQTYLQVARPLTRLLVAGLVLLVLSGVAWLLLGVRLTSLLVVKLVLVAAIFVVGPVIDDVVEPRFRDLAPTASGAPSPAFLQVRRQYVLLELVATSLFYIVALFWLLI